ncbi:MAG: hypothetical protein UT86_C0007G0012 [Candidatus Magasanikbacteria bacterium GW2011_GWC2_40_17]|uniref:Uncharacterized protein n=1 Tax=Candidatus Magasanikbacteria bacterium GW2011_GWA2_42_32 TaxID=1619039 RepID=A0A0G1CCQ0_9BACT|nr:MAG: hypothetical protein UT86_C0007G0012 [Candidatus Magasanikbacteria bacterium GW2011_GWC2_40_17]KKS56471.1 MAG: hypothetical protein UV20_C0011G0012 [Candidatus Magasanikbacteria bacterium GW2011_GWA2_42_32]OGH85056.1 MAG: hypothetical protein A2294_01545 [Candidatus Magasanikbacteria bacterium RIFOXYB2_FULL_38_10]
MRFIFHLLGIVYFVIWIVIGAILLFAMFTFLKVKPWAMLGGTNSLQNISNVFNQAGSVADVIQKIQANKGDVGVAFNSLSKDQQDCLRKELGDKTVSDALSGVKINPTPDLILKAMKCVK